MRRAGLVLSLAVVASLLPMTAVSAEPSVRPAAVATATGTPLQLLGTVPAVPSLRVGYKPGLFPNLASPAKDRRGCTYRNQMLIKLATTKPKVTKGCTLVGGVWYADFGATRVTNANQVRLAKIVPDVYVYGQGASQWTPAQRAAYMKVVPPTKVSSAKTRMRPMPSSQNRPPVMNIASTITIFTPSNAMFFNTVNSLLISKSDPDAQALQALQARFPKLFEGWTVATLLNAKAWGLSLSPGLYQNFGLYLQKCSSAPVNRSWVKPAPASPDQNILTIETLDLCQDRFTVTEVTGQYLISAIPQIATSVPATKDDILNTYGEPTGDTISRFMFGIHAPANWFSDEASGADGPIYPETIPDVPVGYLRLWDTETTWKDIEPSNGTFIWRKLDKQIQMGQQLDARVMLVLGQTPSWAGSSPTSMPTNIDDWRDYVRTVCKRYGPSISAYEVWNEANLQTFWTGTPAQMADLTKAAFEEIRACNPSAQVVAADTTTRATGSFATFFPQYLQELKARGWPADAYAVHSYPAANGGAEGRAYGVAQFRAALALAGAPFTAVYDTEINYGLAGLGLPKVDITGDLAMTLLSRTYIDSARYGLGSTFWFVWTAQPDSKFGIQLTRQTAAERRAWISTYNWLVGSRFQRCAVTTSQGLTVCQFSNAGGNFSIVWRGELTTAPLQTIEGTFTGLGSRVCTLKDECTDLTPATQVTVGPMPIRIDGPPLSSGPAAATPAPGPQGPSGPAGPIDYTPTIVSLDLVYGPRNTADVTARWLPPLAAQPGVIDGYSYTWCVVKGSGCTRVAQGTTNAARREVTTALTEGPGTYRFSLTPINGGSRPIQETAVATSQVVVQRSDAAPPSSVFVGVRGDRGQVTWIAPDMRANLIKGYEVQVRNLPSGPWVTVASAVKGTKADFNAKTDLNLAAGQSVIARVRTVLTSEQTSIFIPSPAVEITGQLPPPKFKGGLQASTFAGFIMYVGANAAAPPTSFPKGGYQVRYTGDGSTWELAKFVSATPFSGGVALGPIATNPSLFPFDFQVEGAPSTGTTWPTGTLRFQVRAIDDSGLQPSEWVDVPLLELSYFF